MSIFLAEAENKGWKKAITESSEPKIRELYLWTDNPSRSDISYYLPLEEGSSVLDLGSGWGSYTFPLSRRVKTIVAADSCLESLKFIDLRARQENITNILPVHMDPMDYGRIPFNDNVFDAVIMNGVLEWVGSYSKKGNPRKMQQKCLSEASRVLKRGGKLVIGMENRFGFKYVLGAPDDHLIYYSHDKKISYTTILPRVIANIITKMRLGVSYRTYTHSMNGHIKMLRSSGFDKIEFYYPEDGYRAVNTRIIPIPSLSAERAMMKRYGNNLLFRFLAAIMGKHYFCDSFFIIGERTS